MVFVMETELRYLTEVCFSARQICGVRQPLSDTILPIPVAVLRNGKCQGIRAEIQHSCASSNKNWVKLHHAWSRMVTVTHLCVFHNNGFEVLLSLRFLDV